MDAPLYYTRISVFRILQNLIYRIEVQRENPKIIKIIELKNKCIYKIYQFTKFIDFFLYFYKLVKFENLQKRCNNNIAIVPTCNNYIRIKINK